jgi:hypothetical protein
MPPDQIRNGGKPRRHVRIRPLFHARKRRFIARPTQLLQRI